ncbi:MAG: hypothetical protein MUO73_01585, partial [Thermoplasmata archaeon]|nr:hypothetical protein [Thermoplasmata archaeon]
MFIQKRKRAVGIGIMLVLTAFVGMTANVSGTGEPPITDAGGPYIADEAGVLIFEGWSFDPDGDPLQYNWYINGTWIGWSDNPDVEYTWFDDYSGEVTLKVTDGDLDGIDTTTVTVLNIIPTDITVTGPYQVFVGDELALWVTFFDGDGRSEGSADTYTAIFDWADDSFSERDLAALEFSFPGAHTYNVEITEPTIYL